MTNYEWWSLVLTALYNVLTFFLLAATVYVTVFQRRTPKISVYHEGIAKDTKSWGWRRQNIDFIIDNRGNELRNVEVKSEPDFLGWGYLGKEAEAIQPKPTSEYFGKGFPYLRENEKKSYFWCDAEANEKILKKPFKIIIEFDNPYFSLLPRLRRNFDFDFSSNGGFMAVNTKYDVHNVAKELTRMRETLDESNKLLEKLKNNLEK